MGQIIILFQMVSLGITYQGVSGKLTEDNANTGKIVNCESDNGIRTAGDKVLKPG